MSACLSVYCMFICRLVSCTSRPGHIYAMWCLGDQLPDIQYVFCQIIPVHQCKGVFFIRRRVRFFPRLTYQQNECQCNLIKRKLGLPLLYYFVIVNSQCQLLKYYCFILQSAKTQEMPNLANTAINRGRYQPTVVMVTVAIQPKHSTQVSSFRNKTLCSRTLTSKTCWAKKLSMRTMMIMTMKRMKKKGEVKIKRNIVEIERPSPRTSCTSWSARLRGPITRMFTAGRNWPLKSTFRRSEFRWVQVFFSYFNLSSLRLSLIHTQGERTKKRWTNERTFFFQRVTN